MSTSRDKTIEITFNLHDRDASFDDESRTFEVAYTLHEPESPSETLPILVMCHVSPPSALRAEQQLINVRRSTSTAPGATGILMSRTSSSPPSPRSPLTLSASVTRVRSQQDRHGASTLLPPQSSRSSTVRLAHVGL